MKPNSVALNKNTTTEKPILRAASVVSEFGRITF